MNQITIFGRLTADPVTNRAGDHTVTNFTVAVDRDRKDKNGERGADFFSCAAWDKQGEIIAKYIGKGQRILLSGSMRSERWETKDGEKRLSWSVQVSKFYFAESGKRDAAPEAMPAPMEVGDMTQDEIDGLPF